MTSLDDWDSHWSSYNSFTEENPAQKWRQFKILRRIQKIPQPFKILDIGSGQGDLLKKVSAFFPHSQVIGIERSQIGISLAQKKLPQAQFIQHDLLNPLDSQYFEMADLVLCTEVLEHLDQPEKLIKNILPLLKENAFLLITVPGGPRTFFDIHIGHRKHYKVSELKRLLEPFPLKIIKAQALGFPFFNLYKMLLFLRGKKLVQDVHQSKVPFTAWMMMKIFSFLFSLNLDFFPWGWQTLILAQKKEKKSL